MYKFISLGLAVAFLLKPAIAQSKPSAKHTYLGFDKNIYPGDGSLPGLRKTFSYSGYWLNNPPGEVFNSWSGKRAVLQDLGFGFLVLFNGRRYGDLESMDNARKLGEQDGDEAARSARREGFPQKTVIFLDQEEGGRLYPEQRVYLHAWVDKVNKGYRAGVYCSGIPFQETSRDMVVTAKDIKEKAQGRDMVFWVSNDSCPPSPGCKFAGRQLLPTASGTPFAQIWQYAQSPRRTEFTRACRETYDQDGNCYAPGFDPEEHAFVDVNTATSPDPSNGRAGKALPKNNAARKK